MTIYSINYDLKKPDRDYEGLYDAIKGCGAWWHYLGSTWLVDTNLDANGIWERVKGHVDAERSHADCRHHREQKRLAPSACVGVDRSSRADGGLAFIRHPAPSEVPDTFFFHVL